MATAQIVNPASSPLTAAILKFRREQDRCRPTGLHISTICDDYCKAIYPAKYKGLNEEAAAIYQEIGNTFEDLLGLVSASRFRNVRKPKPKFYRGLILSPDGENTLTRTIDETKVSWVSSKNFVTVDEYNTIIRPTSPKFFRYEKQIMAYLKAWGWTRARLHVWFIVGNWAPPVPHYPFTYILRYTQREIDDNWFLLMQHARDRRMMTKQEFRRSLGKAA